MSEFILDERLRLMIEMALTANPQDVSRHRQQDADARRLGISGAEIDAARQGRSFDVRMSIALGLAVGCLGDGETRRKRRATARDAGISEQVCREIENHASRLAGGPSKTVRHAR